jgi:hypothetical protein
MHLGKRILKGERLAPAKLKKLAREEMKEVKTTALKKRCK